MSLFFADYAVEVFMFECLCLNVYRLSDTGFANTAVMLA